MYWNVLDMLKFDLSQRLTLTWDVLKLFKIASQRFFSLRLTLTWDVLKLAFAWLIICGFIWLTLTWDVLKWLYVIVQL